jgi:hypothetical protein
VRYTLWSLGRLVGETDFGFLPSEKRQRRGWLVPTEVGEPLVDVAAAVASAMNAAEQMHDLDAAAADIASAIDRRDALRLELRGPDGHVIPLESLAIRDTVALMAMADARVDADLSWYDRLTAQERAVLDREIASDADESARLDTDVAEMLGILGGDDNDAPLPRYEIEVRLVDDGAIPSRE